MAEFMMLMKGSGEAEDWANYIDKLVMSGTFRGGSELSNGSNACKNDKPSNCTVTGFMRFEADDKQQIMDLLPGNPVYEAGGEVEVLEIVVSE